MKKAILLAAVAIGFAAQAQNTGIGTTSPTEKLDVGGNIKSRTIFQTPAAPLLSKTVAVAEDGVLKTKPLPPTNTTIDHLESETPYDTGISAADFAPSVIKWIPYNGILGYYFSVENGKWQITVADAGGLSFGDKYAEMEILWLNK